MIPPEICNLIVELNNYRTGYGELSKIINRVQTKFEEDVVEIYRKMDAKMSAVENLDTEMKDTKYPHLRVATGGKPPPEGPVNNWLAELEVRTTFVARHRNSNDVDYNQYYLLFKALPEVVLLKWVLPDGKLLDYYVDPVRFSKMFPDYVILGIDKEPEVNMDETLLNKISNLIYTESKDEINPVKVFIRIENSKGSEDHRFILTKNKEPQQDGAEGTLQEAEVRSDDPE